MGGRQEIKIVREVWLQECRLCNGLNASTTQECFIWSIYTNQLQQSGLQLILHQVREQHFNATPLASHLRKENSSGKNTLEQIALIHVTQTPA